MWHLLLHVSPLGLVLDVFRERVCFASKCPNRTTCPSAREIPNSIDVTPHPPLTLHRITSHRHSIDRQVPVTPLDPVPDLHRRRIIHEDVFPFGLSSWRFTNTGAICGEVSRSAIGSRGQQRVQGKGAETDL